jgi:hypothetical protein
MPIIVPKPKDRSPSFPFIPLQTAIERLEAFENKFGRHPAPAGKAGLAWGMKEKSSQADQTLAALRSFGLVKYDGMGSERHAVITEDGRNYLRALQDTVKKEILKACALRPKIIRKFWAGWSADRPPDEVALDKLVLENGFSDVGARNFLKVYDDTTAFAGLSSSDKIDPTAEDDAADTADGEEGENPSPSVRNPPPPPTPSQQGKVKVMEGERVVFTEETDPANYVKLVASGAVDDSLLEALEDYVKRQRKRLVTAYQAGVAQMAASGKTPPRTIIGGAGKEDEEAAGAAGEPWNKK